MNKGAPEALEKIPGLILQEITNAIESLDKKYYRELANQIEKARVVFVTGQGRSGLVARMFAMRLIHLGFKVYVIGETVTPSIKKDDLLIVCSGSGETKKVLVDCDTGRESRARVAALTASPASSLAERADYTVPFPGTTTKGGKAGFTQQFGGSLFEQVLLIFTDSLISYIQRKTGTDLNKMMEIHTNLE